MKTFTAIMADSESNMEKAISLPGWSHCSAPFDREVLWYPWIEQSRRIYFTAKNRTDASRQCDKRDLLVRDLVQC